MMRILLSSFLLISCSACTRYVYYDPPEIPELKTSSTIKMNCPGLKLIKDRTVISLAVADAKAVRTYGRCKASAETLSATNSQLISAYEKARLEQLDYIKTKNNKKKHKGQ